MDRRHPTLPTAVGAQHQGFIPHHMSHQNLSTDSTGSVDSFATQVPLPFHMLQGQGQNFNYIEQHGQWGNQYQGQNIQTSSNHYQGQPFPNGGSQYANQAVQAPKLNPASGTFVPSPTFRTSFDSEATYATQYDYGSSRPGSFSSSISSYAPQENQAIIGGGYQNYQAELGSSNGYYPTGNFQQSLSPQFPVTPQPAPPQAGPYSHMEVPAADFAFVNGVANAGTFNTSNPFAQQSPALESVASPTPSHANHISNTWGTLHRPVSAQSIGQGKVFNQTNAQNNNWVHQSANLNAGETFGHSSNDSFGCNGGNGGCSQKSNKNQYRPRSRNSGKSQKSSKGKQNQSNLGTAPVLNNNYYGGPSNNSGFQTAAHDGPGTAKVLGITSPDGRAEKDGVVIARASSRTSHHSSLVSKDIDPKVFNGSTATPKARPLNLEFSSERRGEETPVLRSSRGRSISVTGPTTDPGRKNAVASWLEKTPTQGMDNLSPARDDHRASPPKMASLRPAIGSNVLKSIREGEDPFVSKSLSTLNTTGGISSLAGPYRGTLVGQPGMSKELAILTKNGQSKPTVQEALSPKNLPFVEYCRESKHDEWGVIKIKNIPYNVNRPEVLAFLGRNARIIPEHEHEPVHIIMERVTSKTLDCYVEFVSMNEAAAAVNRFETNRTGGRGGRLGQRHVEVELSCQEELMKELFPKARNVKWVGSKPTILPTNKDDQYSSGFKGFVSSEELVMLVKHVESPQRSPFSKDCPQRPFECLISTLIKFPWYMVDHITISERQMLFNTTIELLILLIERINSSEADLNINNMLFKRVWKAALKCPGFTPTQKDDVIVICGIDEQMARENAVPVFASEWMDIWTIGAKPSLPTDLLLWYIAVIREATERQKQQFSLAELARLGKNANERKLFGDIDKWINHDRQLFPKMTLAQVATAEWGAIESLLRLGLGGPH